MYITFSHGIIQLDNITSRKSFLNARIKKPSNFFNLTITLNWYLKYFSHQLNYIFKALENALYFFFFFLSCHSSKKRMCFVLGFILSETEVTTLCRKHFSSAWKVKVPFQTTAGELTYLCQKEIWPQIWLSTNISIWWFGFEFTPSSVPMESDAGDFISPRRRTSWTP